MTELRKIQGELTNTSGATPAVDNGTQSFVSIEEEHHQIHDGKHFNIRDITTLATSDNIAFGFTTPNGSKWAHFIFEIEGTTQTELRTWEGATLSGGTVGIAFNNNRNIATSSDMICVTNPVVSGGTPTSGTLLEVHSKGLAATPPSKGTNVGESEREDEWMFKSGTTYLFEITNADSSNTNVVDYAFRWYEHISKNLVGGA